MSSYMKRQESLPARFVGVCILGEQELNNLLMAAPTCFIKGCRPVTYRSVYISTYSKGPCRIGSKGNHFYMNNTCVMYLKCLLPSTFLGHVHIRSVHTCYSCCDLSSYTYSTSTNCPASESPCVYLGSLWNLPLLMRNRRGRPIGRPKLRGRGE